MMYLHGDVFVQYENIFCKKTKKLRLFLKFDLFINVFSIAMCYYTRRSYSYLTGATHSGKICSVMWCAVQYSQHPTSITVLSSTYFTRKPFLQYRHDLCILLKYFMFFFKTPTYMTHAVFSPLFSEIKRPRQRAEADGKVAEVEG